MRITVVGAYGYTGKIICRLLDEQALAFTIAGRNENALSEIAAGFKNCCGFIVADLQTDSGIENILVSSDLIINCAGPFTEESQQFIKSVSHSGKKYLDITGEIGFVRDSLIQNQETALRNGALIIHGCAFESLVAAVSVGLAAKKMNGKILEVRTFYQLGHARPSPGTKLTMKLARFREPLRISAGEWSVSDLQHDRLKCEWKSFPDLQTAVPYPLPEIAFLHWEFAPDEVNSFLLLDSAAAMFVNSNQNQLQSKEEIISIHRRKKTDGPDEQSRQKQSFDLIVSVKDDSGDEICLQVSGKDMYLVTAQAILLAVNTILNSKENYSGVISPAVLFRGRESEILSNLGFSVSTIFDFTFSKF